MSLNPRTFLIGDRWFGRSSRHFQVAIVKLLSISFMQLWDVRRKGCVFRYKVRRKAYYFVCRAPLKSPSASGSSSMSSCYSVSVWRAHWGNPTHRFWAVYKICSVYYINRVYIFWLDNPVTVAVSPQAPPNQRKCQWGEGSIGYCFLKVPREAWCH